MFNFKKVTAVAAAFALSLSAVAFVGCGGNSGSSGTAQTQSDSNFVGTWNFSSININGQEMSVSEYAAYSSQQTGQEVTADMLQAQYVFADDGTGKLVFMGTETPFTYTDNGNTANVTLNGTEVVFTYDGGALKITDANTGYISTFTK